MLDLNFDSFPIVETERLILKRLTIADVDVMFAIRSNPDIMKYIPRPLAQNKADILEHIELVDKKINSNECINWAITLKDSNEVIGTIGFPHFQVQHFRGEVGYTSLPQYNGKGYVTEALQAVIAYGFSTLKLHSVEALVDPENIGSMKVLEKCGFVKEAHFKENEYYNGKFIDTVVYSKLNK
ncbi:MAG: GNAT family N-acetyltransferase [Flavobacteriaceae bacterium]|jgi:ribosomal-protein-alanine N-acetyltransferase|nr:GNAT family N-acetyltransferase [Flavobacteriaceae bacterium]